MENDALPYLHYSTPAGSSTPTQIKRVLLAVAQNRSLHVRHVAYFCASVFANGSNRNGSDWKVTKVEKVEKMEKMTKMNNEQTQKEPCRLLITFMDNSI